MKIHYLSYGKYITGGFLHEKFYAESLLNLIKKRQQDVELIQIRPESYFEGPVEHLKMLIKAYQQATGDINILVSRYALPALFKALFTKNKYILVMHYEDHRDGNSVVFRWYFKLFYLLLNLFKPKNFSILTVAPFWRTYFQKKCPATAILYFPNLFDVEILQSYKQNKNAKLIHLGQWSWKNDKQIFQLAEMLYDHGYSCYFSSNKAQEAGVFKYYSIVSESYEAYLTRMSSAMYTIAFTAINEGWNRVAHESIIVGTPVIGFHKGGLADLLIDSNSIIVNDAENALKLILMNEKSTLNDSFINKYSIQNISSFLNESEIFLKPSK